MPLYEYRCENCDKTFEVIQAFSEKPLSECPDCGKPVNKLLSLGSFQLKGKGWHRTDYQKTSAPVTSSGNTSSAEAGNASKPSGSDTQ